MWGFEEERERSSREEGGRREEGKQQGRALERKDRRKEKGEC